MVHQGRDVERMKKVTVTWAQEESQPAGLQVYFVGTLRAVRMTSYLQRFSEAPASELWHPSLVGTEAMPSKAE